MDTGVHVVGTLVFHSQAFHKKRKACELHIFVMPYDSTVSDLAKGGGAIASLLMVEGQQLAGTVKQFQLAINVSIKDNK